MNYKERSEIMEKEYKLAMLKELEEEMKDRYSFAAEIRKKAWVKGWRKGLAEGQAQRICSAIRDLLESGILISQIARIAEVSVEKLQSWLEDESLLIKELMEENKDLISDEEIVKEMEELRKKEPINALLERYINLHRIKRLNVDYLNDEIDCQIKDTVEKLASIGVSAEDLKELDEDLKEL